jgi:hypothetical protein
MSKMSGYDRNSQIEIQTLTIEHHSNGKISDILSIMQQFVIYEDLFQTAMSAKLVIADQMNLVGTLPIVGGEKIKIKYRTPIYNEFISLDFIVYRVGDREIDNSSENIQVNQLFLCTPEVWLSANIFAVGGYTGTYSDIVEKLVIHTETKKKIDKEQSIGIVNYVAPNINYFQAIKFCASRANSANRSPMFFWESPRGYRFKSLKELYRAKQYKFIYIEDRGVSGEAADAEKAFNAVYSIDYLPSNNRLKQFSECTFGNNEITIDYLNARIGKNSNSYQKMFNEGDIKLNKFPLNDDFGASKRTRLAFSPIKIDLSHLNDYDRSASIELMENMRVIVNLPGDSAMEVGQVLWLDLPSKSGTTIGIEKYSSGKWFVRSIKHLINKNTYSIVCELTRDSFDIEV